jgi:uncharacterized protein (TIGR02145 family)
MRCYLKLARDEILKIYHSHIIKTMVRPLFFESKLKKIMKKQITYLFIFLISLTTLQGQVEQQSLPSTMEINNRRSPFNLEELKVRWKKAALENCPGVPCITAAVPGPPTSVTASAGNASASVAFVAPTNNGGSAITGYTVTSSPGGITATGATSPINVTGLTNGTAYTFRVVATNAIGNSVASAASTAITPVAPNTVPGPPTSVVAIAGNASASVAFVAPTNNGGSAITGYTVTSSPGGITATGPTSPINVTGLTNGTAYTFTVVATNAIGNSSPSTASSAVTPSAPTVPGPPTSVTAVGGNAQATISFTAPASNGGSAITGYTVTSSPGGITATGATSPLNVTGLTNGTAYTFRVVATNAVGNSVASAASTAVTPVPPNTVPGPPTAVVATAGNASASVAFLAPTNNGGSAITGYTVTSSPGGFTATGATSPINVTGLTNGTAYTFTIVATNSIGNSVASAASTAVTPVAPNTVPGPPTAVVATAGNAQASVAFVAPTNNGGSAITGYTVTSSPGGITATGATSPINVTGLTNGTAYTFNVVATNAIGNSVASAASTAVTPVAPNTVPDPPTAVVATAGNASASVAFVAPTNNGGSAITGYTVTSSPGGITATGTTSPINVTGLTNGTAYTFSVVATNAIGNSSPSTASSAVTPSAPFPCGTTVADIDGNTYNTVLIGTQCWTKENLKVTKYNDGTPIPDETANTAGWGGLTSGARTDYTGAVSYIATYGYLYNWYAAAGVSTSGSTTFKNICPTGWHVATSTDFLAARTAVGGTAVAGGRMKSTGTTLWNSPNTDADNSSGFSALPGGYRDSDGSFKSIGNHAYFRTATESAANTGWRYTLNHDSARFFSNDFSNPNKSVGGSVRCLKD